MGEGVVASDTPEVQGISYAEWISSRLWVDYGTPFSFDGRPYLKKIHDLNEPKILLRCLTGDAEILLPDGYTKKLRDIVEDEDVGLKVVTWRERSSEFATSSITAIQINGKRRVGRLTLENGMSVVCTEDHRLWVQAHKWIPAKKIADTPTHDPMYKKVAVYGGTHAWSRVVSWEWLGEEPIYDLTVANDHSFVANGIVVHNCGRQVEKSSSLAAKLVGMSCLTNNWKSLYVSSSDKQTRVFSRIRLSRTLSSPYVRAKYFDPVDCVDDVYEKQLKNGSTVFLSYASTEADRIRGISADQLLCDEIQDMVHDVFPVMEETLSHSPNPFRIYAGTPKTLNNAMETHWKNSTQCEWLIWCPCGNWVFQDEKIIKDQGPTCPKCGKLIDPQFGKWVPYGKSDAEFMGFRIPQTMVPWMMAPNKWKELVQKLAKFSQQNFYNEVLGIAHEKGANPLTNENLKQCCDENIHIREYRNQSKYFEALYAGVDWGAGIKSYTVLTIGGFHAGKLHTEYFRRFDTEKDEPGLQVEEIAKTCQRYGVGLIGCDWGGGFAQNKALAMAMSGHADVIQFCESGVKKRDISYQQQSRLYTFNRSMGISMVIQAIKNGDYRFPVWKEFEKFAEDFTCVFEDYNRATRMIVYDHPDDMPDDTLHSLMFMTLTAKVARGEKAL